MGRVALEERAQLVHVLDFLRLVRAYGRAAVGRRDDKPLGLEKQQRLADGRPRNPELARKLLLLQAPTGLEPPVDDRRPNQLGRRCARAPRECRLTGVQELAHSGNSIQCAKSMDASRRTIARAKRREEALASLELERDREEAITQRLEQAVRDSQAWRVDEDVFGRMHPEDVELIRGLGFAAQEPSPEAAARLEARVAQLETEIAEARRRQQVYRRFIEALDGPRGP